MNTYHIIFMNTLNSESQSLKFRGVNMKKLYRNTKNAWIAGVCSGIADYFGLDPTLVRLLWVLLLIVPPFPSIFGYIIAWVIIPPDEEGSPLEDRPSGFTIQSEGQVYTEEVPPSQPQRRIQKTVSKKSSSIFFGWLLIAVGVYFAIPRIWRVTYYQVFRWSINLLPLSLILVGVYLIFRPKK
jgi:phage shock protein C